MSAAASPLAPLATDVMRRKWHILACFGLVLMASLLLALAIRPKYAATSSLLVLLGSEYTVRGNAGEGRIPAGMPDHEQVLRTESEIIGSDALQRATIRAIGLARLYPDYLAEPGWIGQGVRAVKDALGSLAGGGARQPDPDPVDLAQAEFARNFSDTVLKEGDAIELRFTHKDPVLAAAVLNRLVALYLDQRRRLYEDDQLAIVQRQAARQRDLLRAADDRLAAFKETHGIASFDARRDILLREQGDAERELNEAESQASQVAARGAILRRQLATTPEYVRQSDDVESETRASDTRSSLDALEAKLAQMRTAYREDGMAMRAVRAQIAARQAQLAGVLRDRAPTTLHVAANPLWQSVQGDALHAAAELQAASARRAHASAALAAIRGELAALNGLEQQLQALQRQRDVAEADYRTAEKLVADREMVESVAAAKQPAVRQIAPAAVPVRPRPTRLLILLAGTVLAMFSATGLALGSNLLRSIYLLPGEIEQDLGVAVLACVPELPQEIARDLALAPLRE